ncbi:MAG: 1-(5-phosphoribosyl)-5-[(5-phosphoribosylamino)methylideneamino]imidazole-4-carboxamide isomerase [Pseudomonadota bacterium]
MNIIPAIDLSDGGCVRLRQGDFSAVTRYDRSPLELAATYARLGSQYLHLVDLDGAKDGEPGNIEVVMEIIQTTDLRVQIGGGIRSTAMMERWLNAGAARCVIGSLLVKQSSLVREWCAQFGADRIVAALDVRQRDDQYWLAISGWQETSERELFSVLDEIHDWGIRDVLCTDISRDGMMTGPNTRLYQSMVAAYPDLRLQASGGVSSADDLTQLRAANIPYAIVGKALLSGAITHEEMQAFQVNA